MTDHHANLLVIEGVDQGTRFLIINSATIGRGAGNHIRILDTEVSRTHATIKYQDKYWMIEDLSSSNGTFVNGVSIRTCQLESGDQLRFGSSLLLFSMRGDASMSSLDVRLIEGSSQEQHSQIIQKVDISAPDVESVSSLQDDLESVDVMRVLGDIAEQAVRPSMTIGQLLERVLSLTLETVHADRGCILIRNEESGHLAPQASLSRPESNSSGELPVSRSIVDYVIRTGQGVRTNDPLHDTRFDAGQSILKAGVREAMCVPLQGRMELLGVIYLDMTSQGIKQLTNQQSHLTDQSLRLLVAVGRQSALAIENFRYQQSLIDAERLAAIGQTIATLSHHIKNILQGVRGGSYLIDLGLQQSDQELTTKGWHLVEKNQDKIYNLVMDMLSYSKERVPSLKPAQLNDIVQEVSELMESRARELDVTLACELSENIPRSTFDPEGIHRAVLNIVSNAIDAAEESGETGKVVIRTSYDSEREMLSVFVIDNGPGIEDSIRERIFDVFQSTKGSRGTGIGLPVSRKIIQEHSGQVIVESEPGQGTTFILEWPYSAPDQGETMPGSKVE